ncbi:replication protein A 32 kDa subunit [Pseudomyrmex gracilis]|uniref:replication protein A 32 kDa subunit n=1 Tax=Pseudomyrmex gracilis TaxID=219809 RepID=UPI0009952277|nr:replication protein A 32 kDa subunit [Pseudomyrmex gracilis]
MWNESTQSGFGGGFLDDSTAQGGAAKKGSSNDKSIVPVFIKHITSTTGDLQIAGKTVNTLKIVGIVRHIEQDTTKISFTIEDDTDSITAVMWLEADKNPAETNYPEVNTYVQLYGLIRNQNNQQQLLILRMFPLEDLNELTYHFLEVIYFILKASEKSGESETVSNAVISDYAMSGMSPEQVAVLEIVRSANDAECGIEKQNILKKVPKHIVSRLDEILEFLLCEGHIYTTSSEDVFKAT